MVAEAEKSGDETVMELRSDENGAICRNGEEGFRRRVENVGS